MSQGEALTGAEWLARTLAANGTTHVFFIDAVLRRTLIELGTLGVTRVLAHAEKSAVLHGGRLCARRRAGRASASPSRSARRTWRRGCRTPGSGAHRSSR